MSFWWTAEKGSVSGELFKHVRYLDRTQVSVQQSNLRHMRLYLNEDLTSLSYSGLVTASTSAYGAASGKSRLSVNIVKSCIDTLVAKIAKTKIKPTFLTDKGDFKKQSEAKKLNQFVSGLLYDVQMPRLAPMVAKDSFIFGTGFLKVYAQDDEVKAERVFPDEILVDLVDGYYGEPQALYQRRFVSKDVLAASYGDRFDAVPTVTRPDSAGGSAVAVCLVVEAWKLPTSKDSKDGRHVMAVDGIDLLDEGWDTDRFPFAVLRYTEESLGYFGRGIAEELTGHQIEINRITRFIADSMRIAGGIKVWIEAGSKVASQNITNDVSTVSHYVGTPPVFQVVQPVAGEYFQRLEALKQEAYEAVGISQLSASSKNPLGPNASGSALRSYHDIESERFALTGQAYENFHLDVVRLAVDEVKRIIDRQEKKRAKDKKTKVGYKTKAFSRKDGVQLVDWKDIDLDEDSTVLQCFPASALPSEPSARMQTVVEWMQAGLLDKDTGMDLLDFPDLESEVAMETSPRRLLIKICNDMLETGEYISPEPDFDVAHGAVIAQKIYNWGKLTGLSDERLELLRSFKADCLRLSQAATPPPPPGGVGPDGTAQGVPQAPPASPMLPNVG